MLLQLNDLLDRETLNAIRAQIPDDLFTDGKTSALGNAAAVKKNLQLPPDHPATRAAGERVLTALRAHPLFELAAQPRAFSSPLISRYEPGMEYGMHLDAPFMTRERRLRTDLAVTVFLSDKDSYEGGELVVDTEWGEQRYRADAGGCLVYPATTFHRVAPVERGVRLAAVLWVQSEVRDPAQRQILYDLGCAIRFLEIAERSSSYVERLRRTQFNLMRMWAEL